MMSCETPEDILNDSLGLFGGQPTAPGDNSDRVIRYGPLELTVAPKEGKANTLLADHLFSPALLLAERIERGLIPVRNKTIIELGSGSGLPSLLSTTLPDAPRLVVVTDYPDEVIMGNLRKNVEKNQALFDTHGCVVLCRGYEWGESAAELLELLTSAHSDVLTAISAVSGYDIAILSDLLHFQDSHGALVASLTSLLSKTRDARVYIAAGKYTLPHVCENFLMQAHEAGLVFEEGGVPFVTNGESGGGGVEVVEEAWLGKLPVSGLTESQLAVRKAMCRWWVGQWADPTM